MSVHSTFETWVITCHMPYSSLSLAADEVFTTRAEADAELVRANDAYLRMPLRTDDKSPYAVMTLDDFMAQQSSEASNEGRQRERQSGTYSNETPP